MPKNSSRHISAVETDGHFILVDRTAAVRCGRKFLKRLLRLTTNPNASHRDDKVRTFVVLEGETLVDACITAVEFHEDEWVEFTIHTYDEEGAGKLLGIYAVTSLPNC